MKTQVKLGLETLSDAQKVAVATNVGEQLIEHDSTFTNPPVAGADLQDFALTVSDAIPAANAAKTTYHTKVLEAHALVRQLEGMLRQTGSYVQNVSAGNAAIIQLAGLGVRNVPASVGQLDAPVGLTAEPVASRGMTIVRWTPNRLAKAYHVQFATDENFPEATSETKLATRGKTVLYPLRPVTKYWIRVAAINAAGPSNWSNAVSVVTQ